MPHRRPHRRADDLARPSIASLSLPVRLVSREEDEELKTLIERYEEFLYDWEGLSHRALKALAGRSCAPGERRDAVRRS